MSQRLVIDPVTRIEGHLRIEAQMDGDRISEAYSSGTMVRGLEIILQGRDPRDAWAFAQRICGVCTLVHGIASVRAVEDALRYPIPANAELIRNLMIGAQYVHDHVMHFYHLHALDWVDVVSALKADPKATSALAQSLSGYARSSPGYFSDVQKRLQTFVGGGQLGIFGNGYWGHPAYRLPPEANLLAVAHYLDALAWQRDAVALHTVLGGKNPHPNFVVGGAPVAISVWPEHPGRGKGPHYRGGQSGTALDLAGLARIQEVIRSLRDFVDQVYLPDTLAIAGFYKDWFKQGEGLGNFLCFGDLPGKNIHDTAGLLLPRGAILDRNLAKVHEVNLEAGGEIQEFVNHSWYAYGGGKGKNGGLHPYAGETALDYTGPKPPYQQLPVHEAYSWIKSPRWKGHAMEVGPLARVLMLYATGHKQTRELTAYALKKLDLPLEALFSTLGRTAARALETKIIADAMQGWYDQLLANIKGGDVATFNEDLWQPSSWPKRCKGVGFMEAPRGALAHWVVIEDEKIANYQAVVPSTWNAGPRDDKDQPGAYEAALKGHTVSDARQPLEVLRTLHSFDPCIACAVHLVDMDGEEQGSARVV
ncbi:MAG: nickel-dependent hydrogenase large subunit [Rhodocyclaceae bacterium]|nr:nickel-dependent hydrogenase large subunit [Rhodocyclaceae bacterium]